MTSLLHDVAAACQDMQRLKARLAAEQVLAPNSTSLIEQLLAALKDEFDLNSEPSIGRPSKRASSAAEGERENKLLKRRLNYHIGKRQEAEQEIEDLKASKVSNRICSIWFVRIGMAPPMQPAQNPC